MFLLLLIFWNFFVVEVKECISHWERVVKVGFKWFFFEKGEEEFSGSGDVKNSPNSRSFVKELALKHESLRNDFNDFKLYVFKKLDYLFSSTKLVMEKLELKYIDSDVDSEDDIVFVMKKKKDNDGDDGGAASGSVGYFVMFYF